MPSETTRLMMLAVGGMFAMMLSAVPAMAQKGFAVTPKEAEKRVDVTVDGKPFTSYIWNDTLRVPTLYPLLTSTGTPITRGYPLEPRPGERVDHPHHVGLWLNYGNVNGVDFWNNSTFVAPAQQARMGTVVQKKIVKAAGGVDKGELEVETDWVMPDGSIVITEKASFTFRAGPGMRLVERTSTLTAGDKAVLMKDIKEGMFGLRVRKELELTTTNSVARVEADGKAGTARTVNNEGVTGNYRSSEGKQGADAWGTRGKWMMLTGKVKDEDITVAMLDNPKNVGFPTYWHARDYGLFAANPLGGAQFPGGTALNYSLEPKQSTTFRYQLLILNQNTTPEQMNALYEQFVRDTR